MNPFKIIASSSISKYFEKRKETMYLMGSNFKNQRDAMPTYVRRPRFIRAPLRSPLISHRSSIIHYSFIILHQEL